MSKHTKLSRRLMAALLASLLSVSAFVPVVQASPVFSYPDGIGHAAVSGNSSVFNVESVQADGSVYAGGNIDFYGMESMNVQGTLGAKGTVSGNIISDGAPDSPQTVPDLQEGIEQNASYNALYSTDATIESKTIDLTENSVYAAGKLHLDEVTLTGGGYVTAGSDLLCDLIEGTTSDAGCVLYSETGDIIINGSDLVINGIIYAPEGRVVLNVKHLTVNGGIYANDIIVNGTELQLNKTENYDSLVTSKLTADAGADREIYVGETITLTGDCNYDNAAIKWSGDDSITFESPDTLTTNVSFNSTGTFTITLSASAGSLKASDTLKVKVLPSPAKQFTVNSDFDEGTYQGTASDNDELILGQEKTEVSPIEKDYIPGGASGIHVKSVVSKDRITGTTDEVTISYDLTGVGTPISAEEQGVDFIFVIDNSGSMYGSYLENVQIAAKTMLNYMHEGDRYAITDLGRLHIGFTNDREVLEQEIDRIKSGSGSSEMDDGMVIANNLFDSDSTEKRLKYILLLTDGEDCVNYSLERMHEVAQESADRGIRVFSIAMHGEMEAMQDIASVTKGIYKHCPDADTIGNVMEQFANEIFNTAARNVVFKTTINDFSKADAENIIPAPSAVIPNDDGSAELVWNLDPFEIDTQESIIIPIRSEAFADTGIENLTNDTALYYNDKEGTGQKTYLDDISLPCDEYPSEGTWTAVYDSNRFGCPWTGISWNASFPSDSYAEMYVSVSDDNVNYSEETTVENYTDLTGLTGRYIRIKTVLHRSSDGYSPEIKDISVISGTLTLDEPAAAVLSSSVKVGGKVYANKPVTLSAQIDSVDASEKQLTWSIEGTEDYTMDTSDVLHPVITFAEEGTYTVKLNVTNGTEQAESSVQIYVYPEENVEDVVYDNPSQTVSYTLEYEPYTYFTSKSTHSLKLLTEHPEAISWVSVRFNAESEGVRCSHYNKAWVYSNDEDLFTEYMLPNYSGTVTVTAYDWSGNAYPTEFNVIFDGDRPTVSLILPESIYSNNNYYTEDPFTVKVAAEDNGEIAEVRLYVDNEQVELDSDNTYTFIPKEQKYYTFRAEAEDKAGNTASTNSGKNIYKDTSAPYFSPFNLSRTYAYIGNDVTLKAIAFDNQTGLKSTSFYLNDEPITLDENGEYLYSATEAGTFIFKAEAEDNRGNTVEKTATLTVREDNVSPSVSIKADRSREMVVNTQIVYTVTTDDNVGVTKVEAEIDGTPIRLNKDGQFTYRPTKTGTLKMSATAYDKVGNQRTATYQINVIDEDVTPPTISGGTSARYEYNDRTYSSSIYVTDNTEVAVRHFYIDGKEYTDTETIGSTPKYSYTERINIHPLDLGVGDHVLKVIGKDRAGNKTEKEFNFTVVDTTQPYVSLNGSTYYNTGDTITVNVTISDFSSIDTVTASFNDIPAAATNDKEQTITLENAAAGSYSFKITVKDIYGNERTSTRNITVRDTEKPVITLSDVKEEYFMPNLPVIKMSVTDNVAVSSVNVVMGSTTLEYDGEKIILPEDLAEGTYTIRITARDSVGNNSTEIVTFHYGPYRDTTPPTISNILVTPNLPDAGTPIEISVSASDDSGSVETEVKLSDGTQLPYENGVYKYTPEKAGELTFTVTATDPTGNYSTQVVTCTVAEDSQAPTVSVNAPASMKLGDSLTLTVTAEDNKAVTKTGLLLNDKEVALSGGTYQFTPQSEGEYTFTAYALDAQGNRGEKAFVITVLDQPDDEQLKKYLVIDDETTPGDQAAAKADELKTASAVYEYVKNNVRTQFYSGSRKGAKATFEQLGGNDVDTASLTIGMLRHLGYPARYVTGRVRYSGDQLMAITGIKDQQSALNLVGNTDDHNSAYTTESGELFLEVAHTWVEVYAPLSETGANSSEKAWITLTPDNKYYDYKVVSAEQKFGEGRKEAAEKLSEDIKVLESNGIKTDLSSTKAACNSVLSGQKTTVEFQDKLIHKESIKNLPSSAEISIITKTNTYDNIPDRTSDMITFSIGSRIYNYEYRETKVLARLKTSDIAGKRILLQYIPATESDQKKFDAAGGNWKSLSASSVNVKPTLTIDGEIIGQGYPVSLGTEEILITNVKCSGITNTLNDKIRAGSMYAIVPNLYDISAKDIEKAFENARTNATSETEYGPYSEEYLGALLDCAGKMYFSLNDLYEFLNCSSLGIVQNSGISVGMFSYEFSTVKNFIGQTDSVTDGNFNTDIGLNPYSALSITGNQQDVKKFDICQGAIGSYLESFIWEYILEKPAISTMTALSFADELGIDLLCINSKNADTVLPMLETTTSVYNDVKSHVDQGYTVIIPQKDFTVKDWTGTGYIISDTDEERTHNIYRISGDLNGGASAEDIALEKKVNEAIEKGEYIITDELVNKAFAIRVIIAKANLYMAETAIMGSVSSVAAGGFASVVGAISLAGGIKSYSEAISAMFESCDLFLEYYMEDSAFAGVKLVLECINDISHFILDVFKSACDPFLAEIDKLHYESVDAIASFLDNMFHITEWLNIL